ncbi:MAG: hypothetical protein GY846_03790 [Deltaproteobacteria bacterium]|nr:hypothetical protein [Deltaproteobacteria bacterium]
MELKQGYKQTEAEVIPEDWDVKSICEIGQIQTGPFGTLLRASEYSDNEGVPLVSVGEIKEGNICVAEHTPRVPEKVLQRLPQYILKTGDIVFARKGSVDRSAIVTQAENGWFLGSDGIRIRPSSNCHPPYLAAQFQSKRVQSWLIKNAIGTTMASLNQAILSQVQIPYATESEQRAIATALSDVDALLDGLDRLIAKKRDLKQAAMQQLLTGKTRLPGFEGEWSEERLGDHGSFLKGSGVKKDESQSGEIPCVRYGELYTKHHEYIKSYYSFITPTVAKTAQLLKRGDILFAGSGETKEEIGKCAAFLDEREVYAGGDVVIFRPEGIDSLYLGFYLNAPAVNRQKASKGQGDAVVHISASALADLIINIPTDVHEQAAIAAVLKDMDAEIEALEQRRAKTHNLKLAMMQELLTGRIRLV